MRIRVLWAVSLLAACNTPPDPCTSMCATATDRYGSCLAEWDVAWEAAGYADANDFRDACDTWAWTSRHLEEDAQQDGAVDQMCRDYSSQLGGGTCDDFTAIDWAALPWSPAQDSGTAP